MPKRDLTIVSMWEGGRAVRWFQFGKKRYTGLNDQEASQIGRLIDEQITWTKQFLTQRQFSGAGDAFEARLARIQQRRSDPRFYLAVIGEFNSGKSTFINALLGDDLLRVGMEPMTASPTRMVYGKRLDVAATFQNAGRLRLGAHKRRMIEQIRRLSPQAQLPNTEARDIIGALTADNQVARAVSEVQIEHPGAFLHDGIVIIDTPGLNNEYSEHERATIQVIEQESDLCIIAVPAMWQSSMSFLDFLRRRINPMLHRCVFVVTKMDLIDEEERPRVTEQVTRGLEGLGLRRPMIYEAAARASVTRLRRSALPPEEQRWAEQFDGLKVTLAQRLRQDRQMAVIERLIRLLADILKDLDVAMAAQQQALTQQAELLRQAAITDLDAFVRQERAQAEQKLLDALGSAQLAIRQRAETLHAQAASEIHQAILDASNIAGLKSVAETGAPAILAQYGLQLSRTLEQSAQQIDQASVEARAAFQLRFHAAFVRLQQLTRKPVVQAAASSTTTSSLSASSVSVSALAVVRSAESQSTMAIGGMGAVGAALGTFLIPIPVFGTLIGGAIGGWLGSLFGPSLVELKSKMWSEVQPLLVEQFDQWVEASLGQLESVRQLRSGELNRLIDGFAAQYRGAYNQVLAEQERERQRLNATIATIDRDREQVSQRRALLERQLADARTLVAAPSAGQTA